MAADRAFRPAAPRPLGAARAGLPPPAVPFPAPGLALPAPQAPAAGPARWGAVVVSGLLHAGAALALALASPFAGGDAAGEAGQDSASLPEPPALMVEILTPADLVSDQPPPPPPTDLSALTPAAPAPPADLPAPPPEALPDLPKPAPQLALLSSDTEPAAETAPPPPKPKPKAEAKPPAPEKPAKPPVQKAKPPAAPAPAPSGAKAAGSGGGTKSGIGGKAEASGLSKSEVADLKAAWGAKIQAQLERRRTYPRDAGRAEGLVLLELTVAPSGALLAVRVIKSSGAAVLDRAAVKAAQSAGRFPKAPAQLTDPAYKLILQLKYDRRG